MAKTKVAMFVAAPAFKSYSAWGHLTLAEATKAAYEGAKNYPTSGYGIYKLVKIIKPKPAEFLVEEIE